MPSKRTNDSVDRILEDLNIQQAQAGLRDSVTDHQVDEILRSVGISTAPAQPVQGGFAFEADDDLGALLNDPVVARLLDLTDRMEAGSTSYGPVCDCLLYTSDAADD